MHIIQSFWSKPLQEQFKNNSTVPNFAGWSSLEALFSSWTLSCLTINEYYPNKTLYTDDFGKTILIDLLELPYSDCKLVFDEINHFDTSLWAIGKIYTYSLQNKPFLHIDGDIFIWERFSDNFVNGQIIAQNLEKDPSLYDDVLKNVLLNLQSIPKEAKYFIKKEKGNFGINMGIFGGQNFKLIQKYSNETIKFIETNEIILKNNEIININMFFEQYLLLCFTKYYGEEVTFLFENLSNNFNEILNFHLIPFEAKYIHVVGKAKSNLLANEQICLRLKMAYPKAHKRVFESIPIISQLMSEKL